MLISIGVLIFCMVILYQTFSHNWGSALLAALVMGVAGFVFAAVAGYLVGIIGSSSNPISGLTLSTLLIAAVLMVLVGMKGDPGVAAVLAVASVVCCVAGVAGEIVVDSQNYLCLSCRTFYHLCLSLKLSNWTASRP